MKTHPCDLLTMTAEQAWENINAAVGKARTCRDGYWRAYWLEIAKRSTDVWLERTENRLTAKYLALAIQRDDLDRSARRLVR